LDDGIYFLPCNQQTTWANAPTVRHSLGAALSFADGHAERWKWQGLHADLPLNSSAAGDLADLVKVQNTIFTP
jgi:prepilin-type processing-associated H-X9-DG protein